MLVATSPQVDVLLEVTGAVEDAIAPVLAAIEHGKHVALMNPELDGTLGPLLKAKADRMGVVFTDVDGDQPGVEGNLWRFVKGLGVRPVLCGNIKGLQDRYRTPTTQAAFAARWQQNPAMVTSFADGTKVSFEQAVVANATGMTVAKRGMHGYTVEPGTPLMEAAKLWDPEELLAGPGIVDYVVGAAPGPGVFVLGTIEHPRQRHYLNLYKLGEGPIYCFHTPYHLCHFEVPTTIARAALFQDAVIAPIGAPRVEVVALAKRDLKAGEVIDELGGYLVYGEAEAAEETARAGTCPSASRSAPSSGATSPRTRCSPTPTWSCRRAAWWTSSAPSRRRFSDWHARRPEIALRRTPCPDQGRLERPRHDSLRRRFGGAAPHRPSPGHHSHPGAGGRRPEKTMSKATSAWLGVNAPLTTPGQPSTSSGFGTPGAERSGPSDARALRGLQPGGGRS